MMMQEIVGAERVGRNWGVEGPTQGGRGQGEDDSLSDMKFVHNFTPPDFQAKTFTPSISPNFNSFSKKKHKKVKMEKFAPLAKILHCCRQ